MIIEAARAAMRNLLARELRSVFLKAFGLTLLALAALWFGLKELFDWLALPWLDAMLPGLPSWAGWLGVVAAIVAGIGLALALTAGYTVNANGYEHRILESSDEQVFTLKAVAVGAGDR